MIFVYRTLITCGHLYFILKGLFFFELYHGYTIKLMDAPSIKNHSVKYHFFERFDKKGHVLYQIRQLARVRQSQPNFSDFLLSC